MNPNHLKTLSDGLGTITKYVQIFDGSLHLVFFCSNTSLSFMNIYIQMVTLCYLNQSLLQDHMHCISTVIDLVVRQIINVSTFYDRFKNINLTSLRTLIIIMLFRLFWIFFLFEVLMCFKSSAIYQIFHEK